MLKRCPCSNAFCRMRQRSTISGQMPFSPFGKSRHHALNSWHRKSCCHHTTNTAISKTLSEQLNAVM